MVELSKIQSSNQQIATALPSGLVAVFVGSTSGIGEYAMKAFIKHSVQPRVYIVGRSKEAADRITADVKVLNSKGEYVFIQEDISLITGVDKVCKQIMAKEATINLLFQSQGTLITGTTTSEQLHFAMALAHYSRARFIANLLPLIQQANSLRRVVSVFAGTKEGKVDNSDFQGLKIPMTSARGHTASLITLTMAHFVEQAPTVSFVHDFPGAVKSNIGRGTKGIIWVMGLILKVIGPLVYIPHEEVGERHLFYATNGKYPAQNQVASLVPLPAGVSVAKGIDGKPGSGVYTVDHFGEEGGDAVVQFLADLRKDGMVEKAWEDTVQEFMRITGVEAI